MKMKVKVIDFDAGGKMVSIINKDDAREIGVMPLDRLNLVNGKRKITVVVNTSQNYVNRGIIGIFKKVAEKIKLKNGSIVDVELREELISKLYIRQKIEGGKISYMQAKQIIDDVINFKLNDLEISSFITALHIRGMNLAENEAIARAMIESSKKINIRGKIVDKHSLGGVPGDKTSMLVVPIVAAAGLKIPKTSSRSITSPAGTADRMEVLAPVDHSVADIRRIVRKTNGCLVWGGAVELAPADDLFIQVEQPLAIDPLLIPSVMSKKKVAGSKYVVIDIPIGPEAKIIDKRSADMIGEDFINLGKKIGIKVKCAVTRGDQPIGFNMGPSLEAREVMENLMNIKMSKDLVDKATSIAGMIFELSGKGDKSYAMEILASGKAEKKMREIIKAQGGDPSITPSKIPYAKYSYDVASRKTGVISAISNAYLVSICRAAGTPKDQNAGIRIYKKIGDYVSKGDMLYTVYSEKKGKMKKAAAIASADAFTILGKKPKNMLIERIS